MSYDDVNFDSCGKECAARHTWALTNCVWNLVLGMYSEARAIGSYGLVTRTLRRSHICSRFLIPFDFLLQRSDSWQDTLCMNLCTLHIPTYSAAK